MASNRASLGHPRTDRPVITRTRRLQSHLSPLPACTFAHNRRTAVIAAERSGERRASRVASSYGLLNPTGSDPDATERVAKSGRASETVRKLKFRFPHRLHRNRTSARFHEEWPIPRPGMTLERTQVRPRELHATTAAKRGRGRETLRGCLVGIALGVSSGVRKG